MCFVVDPGPRTATGCAKERIWATWASGTPCGGQAPGDREAGQGEIAAGGERDITAVLAQVSALQSEIDRLIALVNTAAKKLED